MTLLLPARHTTRNIRYSQLELANVAAANKTSARSLQSRKRHAGTYQDNKGVNTVYSVVCKQPRTETPADSSAAENANL
ncbi:hypothetical protein KOW79_006702 [Hemibagrus wyckioides]|uniref:Uncharacterized protein n=1 Tax=Hemibagrus wyckioides TaxID=337641 RepID=A0A9D3P084_9TELE|nr:hypothetical protein KOW79_006702 [Hemibagrus wyckioides]